MDSVEAQRALATLHGFRFHSSFVAAFNCAGTFDFVMDYYHASRVGLPESSGQLGAANMIPSISVAA